MSFILTLRFDPVAQAFFEQMRQEHFPPSRNQVPAHLTLFHQLPEDQDVLSSIRELASKQMVFPVEVTGLRSLGRGVAYTLVSPELLTLHRKLAASLENCLIPQDRQRFMPHVVIQNKVTAAEARTLMVRLQVDFTSSSTTALGLDLWQYLGGPWQHEETFYFQPLATEYPK